VQAATGGEIDGEFTGRDAFGEPLGKARGRVSP